MLPVTFSHDGYRYFLTRFLRAGYESRFFIDPIPEKQGLFIRHDIDFDATSAAQMAVIERNIGIKSTYFFQVTGNIYNPASKSFQQSLELIVQSGHEIGLYFDPSAYPDVERGVKDEMEIFEFLLKRTPKVASIVKPTKQFKEGNGHLKHIPHCHEAQFSDRMMLFTDDSCQFREEMPLESETFIQKNNIHLQIQPIWWIMPAKDAAGKMQMLLERQLSRFKSYHIQRNPNFRVD